MHKQYVCDNVKQARINLLHFKPLSLNLKGNASAPNVFFKFSKNPIRTKKALHDMSRVLQDKKYTVKRLQTPTGRWGGESGQRSLDIDSFTDGRLSLEKQTLQNEELK